MPDVTFTAALACPKSQQSEQRAQHSHHLLHLPGVELVRRMETEGHQNSGTLESWMYSWSHLSEQNSRSLAVPQTLHLTHGLPCEAERD